MGLKLFVLPSNAGYLHGLTTPTVQLIDRTCIMAERERESLRPLSPSYGSTLVTGSSTFSVSVDVDPQNEHGGSGVNISFHDVSYEVSSWFGRKRKVILNSAR